MNKYIDVLSFSFQTLKIKSIIKFCQINYLKLLYSSLYVNSDWCQNMHEKVQIYNFICFVKNDQVKTGMIYMKDIFFLMSQDKDIIIIITSAIEHGIKMERKKSCLPMS